MSWTPRGLGHRPDRPKLAGERADRDFDELGLPSASLPESSNAPEQYVLNVLDQGQLGSCVANSVAQNLRAQIVKQMQSATSVSDDLGASTPALPSRLWLYYLGRAEMHDTGDDTGTEGRLVFDAAAKMGFPVEAAWPYSDSKDPMRLVGGRWTSGGRLAPFQQMPQPSAFVAAYDQAALGTGQAAIDYFKIKDTGTKRLDAIKAAIAAGHLVSFGAPVSNEFCRNEIDPSSPLGPPDMNDVAGGHEQLFSGYDKDGNVRVLNSWSKDFGDAGYSLWAPDYVLWSRTTDLWVVRVAPNAAGWLKETSK